MSDKLAKRSEQFTTSIQKSMQNDPEKLGSALVEIATKRYDKEFSDQVITFVQTLIKHKEALQFSVMKAEKEMELTDRRIEAIERGEFTIERYTGRIIFKDSVLQFG